MVSKVKRLTMGFLALAAGLAATAVNAQTRGGWSPPAPQVSEGFPRLRADDFLDTMRFAIWPSDGSVRDDVTVTVHLPYNGRQSGAAVIVAPGGGYISLAGNLEGRQVADWFASRGVTAFVLKYRYGEAGRLPVPITDGERAIRFVRANAANLGIDADRIGMIGFSAGGHLTAATVAASDDGEPTSADAVDRVSSRPDFMVLGYPWMQATALLPDGTSPYCRFATYAGRDCNAQDFVSSAPLTDLVGHAPPTFLYHTTDDELVPVSGTLDLYRDLQAAGVEVEMHLFAHGAHGSGLGGTDPALTTWPGLLEAWLRAKGLFEPRAVAP